MRVEYKSGYFPFSPLLGLKFSGGILWICKQIQGLRAGPQSQSTDTSLQEKYNSLWIELCHPRSCFWMSVRVTIQSLNAYNPFLRAIIPETILVFPLTAGGFHLWPGFLCLFFIFLFLERPRTAARWVGESI